MNPEEPGQSQPLPATPTDPPSLEQRLNQLEVQMQEVLTLLRAVAPPSGTAAPALPPERAHAVPAAAPTMPRGQAAFVAPQAIHSAAGAEVGPSPTTAGALESEQWLTRFGVLLLVVGIAFVVRYTASLGWWTESARFAGSTLLGAALVGASWWQSRTRPGWSVLVAGAGYAVLHISMVGAFRFYGLVPQTLALAGVAIVAALSVADTWRRQHDAPSMIGLAGAWVAPFVTADWGGADSTGGWFLVLYFAMSAGAWWMRASDLLLGLHVVGGVSAGLMLLERTLQGGSGDATAESTWLATAVLLAVHLLLVVFLAPLRRAWGGPRVGASALVLTPVGAVSFVMLAVGLWTSFDSRLAAGALFAGAALFCASSHLVVRRWSPDPFEPAATAALVNAAVAAALLAPAPWQMLALAAVIGLTQLGSRKFVGLAGAANAGVALTMLAVPTTLMVWLVPDVRDVILTVDGSPARGLISQALPWLVICGGAWGVVNDMGRMQALVGYLMALGAVWAMATGFDSPQLVVSVGWSALAVGAIVVGLAPARSLARWVGILTLGAVVGRLLLFDLDALSPLLRIGIFSGLGVILLIAGYVVPRLARTGVGDEDPPQQGVP